MRPYEALSQTPSADTAVPCSWTNLPSNYKRAALRQNGPRMALSWPQDGPRTPRRVPTRPKWCQDGARAAPDELTTAQDGPQDSPRQHQNGPGRAPGRPQDGLRRLKLTPRSSQGCPGRPQHGPIRAQVGPSWPQDGSRMAQDGPKPQKGPAPKPLWPPNTQKNPSDF